jgi:hypothetical protein
MDIGDLSSTVQTLIAQLFDKCKKIHIFGVCSLFSPKFGLLPISLSCVAFCWTLEQSITMLLK